MKVHWDCETRSRVDIWGTGAYVYAADPSTELMCLAYAVDNGPVKIIRRGDIIVYPLIDPFEEFRALANNKDVLFYSHNSLFERFIFEFKMREQFGLPELPIKRWRCTAAKALSHGLPKALKNTALTLGTKEQKDWGGHAVMLKVCKPKSDGTWNEDPALITRLEDYCAQDVATEREIDNRLPELTPAEQEVWFEDQLINSRGIAVDKEAVLKCAALVEEETKVLTEELAVLTNGKVSKASKLAEMGRFFASKGVKLPNFTKATVETAIKSGDLPPQLVQVLRIRQQAGLTSTAKYATLIEALCEDSRLRDTLVYHAAGTGRWGGQLVQLQNLPKGTIKDTDTAIEAIKEMDLETLRLMYGDIMGLLSSCIRGMFVASPGHDLIVSDYNAIEARVLMWLAGQENAVKMFADGADIYTKMAEKIGPGATRDLGKAAVLGCGFGMGHVKFQATCAGKGIHISESDAEKAVNAYRTSFPKVPNFWRDQEQAMRTAILTKEPVTAGKVTWEYRGDFLYCLLPSGRSLAYHKARVTGGKIKYKTTIGTTHTEIDTYGGKAVENITQAVARDLLAWAMVRAERAGYPIVLSVHDELVAEVPEGFGALEDFNNVLCKVPKWAEGCPVKAAGWRGKRYKK